MSFLIRNLLFLFLIHFSLAASADLIHDKLQIIGDTLRHFNTWDTLSNGKTSISVEEAEKMLENVSHIGMKEKWAGFSETDSCLTEIKEVRSLGATDETIIEWQASSEESAKWTLAQAQKACENVYAAAKSVTKEYCYKFTAYVHERNLNDYFMLNSWVTDCKEDGGEIKCAAGQSDMNSNNLYQPVRIDCTKMPKDNVLGKAFKKLDPYFQNSTWKRNMCYEHQGGVTVASADQYKNIKLAKGSFMGKKVFKALEVECYHKGIHTSKSLD